MSSGSVKMTNKTNLAIQIGINPNPIHDCWEAAAIIGNIPDEEAAKKIAKLMHDIIWPGLSAEDAEWQKHN